MSDNLVAVTTPAISGRRRYRPTAADRVEGGRNARLAVSRPARAYAEILQEIRVAQTGSQVLLGFLLSLGFTERFSTLNHTQQSLYVGALGLSVAATALLVAPTAFRQLNFRWQTDHMANAAANRFVLSGLTMLMCAIIGSLLFALSSVFGFGLGATVAVGALVWFVSWWYVFPFWSRLRHSSPTAGPIAEPVVEPAQRLSA
jgi:Family of unknown function (DUF6328)